MTTVKLPDDPLALPDDDASRAARRSDVWKISLQLVLGLGLFSAAVFFASRHFRPELEAASRYAIERLGYPGLFLGTFLADAFSFPIPPQLYMLAAITMRRSGVLIILAVSAGSLLGGNVARWLGSLVGDRPILQRLLGRTRGKLDAVFARYGYWAIAVGALMPLPYSLLCYLAGAYRMPSGLFAAMSLLRVPRLIFFYFVLHAGFGS